MAKEKVVVPGKKKKLTVFDIVLYIVFAILSLIIIIPIWKVLIDSFNAVGVYKFQLWPSDPTFAGYLTIATTAKLARPFINSVVTTVVGTLIGLVMSTLGGYVLNQYDMPGRSLISYFLLFTMIFSGGMIPEYLVMKRLGLVDNMWILVVKHGMNVYNLVLMKNFFEGIPGTLYEAAKLDGCSPMQIFYKIVLPLSKAALASIGLMFAVTIWNDYSTVQIYITNPTQVNFQYQLRVMIMDGDTPTTAYKVSQNTLYYASIVCAILPFMVAYPFLQDYFVQGVNVGAVKE
ncbi:MAG: carbohydrate ABC transporter permease [Lachnospiraceae bacterium]|jgi:putative aldouronate transport system permease protein|nr:carbohydrate ABC transporter permease [Lachnospiraceae bacterium]MBR6397428.1 carbohydrate ABC transporter permease [Lachnospiraceae bacterium]MEE1110496.1 carbohydrate ABC transporter permease [Lachnospiraceae bacterium]MEE3376909.1 carbohydrate ABC transporter permease [Lachnospiraceae bacterium]MEE3436888.1 carbohydrate ABC transporter permease [Lachnospiraceae bacterium]